MSIIYMAENILNGKRYIGKTKYELRFRQYTHKYQAFKKNSPYYFHRALRKYGMDNFSWSILYQSDNEQEVIDIEDEFIQKYNTIKEGYNMVKGGYGGDLITNHPNKKEIIEKMTEINRKLFLGKHLSEEQKLNISKNATGVKRSEESKKRISESKSGENHPNWNKKMSEETNNRRRISMMGKNKGKKRSEEFKKKKAIDSMGEKNPHYKPIDLEGFKIDYLSKMKIESLAEKYKISTGKVSRTVKLLNLPRRNKSKKLDL